MDLGERIAGWLRAKGLSQRALAAKLKVSPGAVNAWVKGRENEGAAPTQRNLESMVAVFGITMAEFYGRIPKPKKAAA